MVAGDEKTLSLSFPDDYHNEELKGAAVEFKIVLNSVQELMPAELNEELFAKYGVETGGLDTFRSEVRQNMARELKNAVQGKVKQQVMDAVAAAHVSLEVPRALVAREIDAMRKQMFQQFGGAAGQDLDLNSLLPDDMFRDNAENRVKLGLVLAELVGKFQLKVDAAKVREIRESEDIEASYGLRVKVMGGGCAGFQYDLYFDEPAEGDNVFDVQGIQLLCDQMSFMYLMGTTIDYVEGLQGAGFKFGNPNTTGSCGCGSSFSV